MRKFGVIEPEVQTQFLPHLMKQFLIFEDH